MSCLVLISRMERISPQVSQGPVTRVEAATAGWRKSGILIDCAITDAARPASARTDHRMFIGKSTV